MGQSQCKSPKKMGQKYAKFTDSAVTSDTSDTSTRNCDNNSDLSQCLAKCSADSNCRAIEAYNDRATAAGVRGRCCYKNTFKGIMPLSDKDKYMRDTYVKATQ
jgi:hypothetical protein